MTRVFVLARSPALRAGLETLIAESHSASLVGAAADPGALEEAVHAREPDVIVLALDENEALPLPLRLAPDAASRMPAVVVLVARTSAPIAESALRAGARAIVPLDASPEELGAAIEAAAHGLVAVPAESVETLLRFRRQNAGAGAAPSASTWRALTPREVEILELLAEGQANKVVATRLGISESTVKTHVASILEKLNAGTRAEAVAIAARRGELLL